MYHSASSRGQSSAVRGQSQMSRDFGGVARGVGGSVSYRENSARAPSACSWKCCRLSGSTGVTEKKRLGLVRTAEPAGVSSSSRSEAAGGAGPGVPRSSRGGAGPRHRHRHRHGHGHRLLPLLLLLLLLLPLFLLLLFLLLPRGAPALCRCVALPFLLRACACLVPSLDTPGPGTTSPYSLSWPLSSPDTPNPRAISPA